MGQTYDAFKKACVNVTGNSMQDSLTLRKLLGGQHHAAEWFTFNINGQNQNFSADQAQLAAPNYVLADSTQEPASDSIATDLFNDIRAYGVPFNDLRGDAFPTSPAPAAGCGYSSWVPDSTGTPQCPSACSSMDCDAAYEDARNQGQDLHGTATIMGYFRQLVFEDLVRLMPSIGMTPQANPANCWSGGATTGYVFPSGCTGFEMMVSPSYPIGKPDTVWQDQMDLGPVTYSPLTVFRSGDPVIDFLADPSLLAVYGGPDDSFIPVNDVVQAALAQVTYVMGKGNLQAIPANARDWRYYFQFWAQSFMSYMLNRSKDPTWYDLWKNTCGGVAGGCRQVNQDQLFFDLNNGLDKFEYVDRTQAATLGAPLDFEYDVLITSTNTQQMNAYQRLTRAENALYTSMLQNKKNVPGSNENVNVSDLFGSPAIAAAFGGDPPAADGAGNPVPGRDTWWCVSNVGGTTTVAAASNGFVLPASGTYTLDVTSTASFASPIPAGGIPLSVDALNGGKYTSQAIVCTGVTATSFTGCSGGTGTLTSSATKDANGTPENAVADTECAHWAPTDASGNTLLDGEGRPLFTNYHGVFTGTAFSIGQTLPITQVLPLVQGALVDLPNYANPYDLTSMNTPLSVFVPHIPDSASNGFQIPINGQRSQWIQTGSLDFSGVTITMNVDYLPQYDMSGNLNGGTIAAVETQDFLGEVWPCVDPASGDILRVKMYSSALDITNWLDAHPASRAACNIFIRYSPYNNYPDYIWSNTNGVLLGIEPGAGGGPSRISDVTLFNPSLLTQTQ
jgi:hypothetical protein